jgi:hypothetical protein
MSLQISYSKELPRFVKDMLSCPPPRGGGLHKWLFKTARVLHPFRSEEQIIELLRASVCDQPVKAGEIESAVKNSKACAWTPGYKSNHTLIETKWPKINKEQREAVIAQGGTLADLWELSPIRCDEDAPDTEEIIDRLMGTNCLICAASSTKCFDTKQRQEWQGQLGRLQFIVPSPMSAPKGQTKEGKTSSRCLENVGPRRFLVIEQDCGTQDEQAAVILHLARKAPLALVLSSGGKSIHGWFYCWGIPENALLTFMREAVALGADDATWSKVQLVRMPNGLRQDNGKIQKIYFYNPEVVK